MKILPAFLLCVLLTAQAILAQASAASAPAAKPQDPSDQLPARDGVTPWGS